MTNSVNSFNRQAEDFLRGYNVSVRDAENFEGVAKSVRLLNILSNAMDEILQSGSLRGNATDEILWLVRHAASEGVFDSAPQSLDLVHEMEPRRLHNIGVITFDWSEVPRAPDRRVSDLAARRFDWSRQRFDGSSEAPRASARLPEVGSNAPRAGTGVETVDLSSRRAPRASVPTNIGVQTLDWSNLSAVAAPPAPARAIEVGPNPMRANLHLRPPEAVAAPRADAGVVTLDWNNPNAVAAPRSEEENGGDVTSTQVWHYPNN